MSKLLQIGKVSPFIEQQIGIRLHRRTIYRWVYTGKAPKGDPGGEKIILQSEMRSGQLYTREKWVLDFLRAVE